MKKVCIRCNEKKELELFAKGKRYKDGRRNVCKRCHTDYMIEYYKRNDNKREYKNKINSRKDFNWKKHKISEETFNIMVAKFDGKCYACRTNEARSIDHDHSCCPTYRSCGKCVRGILCVQCNTALGLLKDSTDRIYRLIEYLNNSRMV